MYENGSGVARDPARAAGLYFGGSLGWSRLGRHATSRDLGARHHPRASAAAGHRGQECEISAPFDEADGKDETLMFHDFDPENPREGCLNDDELRASGTVGGL